eukprot:TRINITY_DN1868_c0_g1_i1.p1 TRINITY_DN1868_c0_g1~~TRINITY_DN1868_c0_g1_i1.p1  ORF type:complete len:752 (+),score=192.19 TRINITY_DN1868_c0_g1_i1:249-2504(+)
MFGFGKKKKKEKEKEGGNDGGGGSRKGGGGSRKPAPNKGMPEEESDETKEKDFSDNTLKSLDELYCEETRAQLTDALLRNRTFETVQSRLSREEDTRRPEDLTVMDLPKRVHLLIADAEIADEEAAKNARLIARITNFLVSETTLERKERTEKRARNELKRANSVQHRLTTAMSSSQKHKRTGKDAKSAPVSPNPSPNRDGPNTPSPGGDKSVDPITAAAAAAAVAFGGGETTSTPQRPPPSTSPAQLSGPSVPARLSGEGDGSDGPWRRRSSSGGSATIPRRLIGGSRKEDGGAGRRPSSEMSDGRRPSGLGGPGSVGSESDGGGDSSGGGDGGVGSGAAHAMPPSLTVQRASIRFDPGDHGESDGGADGMIERLKVSTDGAGSGSNGSDGNSGSSNGGDGGGDGGGGANREMVDSRAPRKLTQRETKEEREIRYKKILDVLMEEVVTPCPNGHKRYKKMTSLGKGGFGHVYRANDTKLNRHVAVKIMPFRDESASIVHRLKEAKAQAKCTYPNVVNLYETHVVGQEVWVVMPQIKGGTIDESLRRGSWGVDVISYVAKELLHAVKFCHKQKVVHRDIKCSNVFLTSHGKVKLFDFGLATDLEDTNDTSGAQLMGSPYYIAPETINRSHAASPAMDIWCVGITLYTMSARVPPYAGNPFLAMYSSATGRFRSEFAGLLRDNAKFNHKSMSEEFIDFIDLTLTADPTQRPSANRLLKHPFIRNCTFTRDMMTEEARNCFMSSVFANAGLAF